MKAVKNVFAEGITDIQDRHFYFNEDKENTSKLKDAAETYLSPADRRSNDARRMFKSLENDGVIGPHKLQNLREILTKVNPQMTRLVNNMIDKIDGLQRELACALDSIIKEMQAEMGLNGSTSNGQKRKRNASFMYVILHLLLINQSQLYSYIVIKL